MKVDQVQRAVEALDQLILERFGTVKTARQDSHVTIPRGDNTHSDFAHLRWCLLQIPGFMEEGSVGKGMRWLGFVQGALWMTGLASVDELRAMNKPNPEYYLKEPKTELTMLEAMNIVQAIQNHLYVVDNKGKVDPNKDVNGGDLVEALGAMLNNCGLSPQIEGEKTKKSTDTQTNELLEAYTTSNDPRKLAKLLRSMKGVASEQYPGRNFNDRAPLVFEAVAKYLDNTAGERERHELSVRGFEDALKKCQAEREKLTAELKLERLGHEGARNRLEKLLNKKPAKRKKKR